MKVMGAEEGVPQKCKFCDSVMRRLGGQAQSSPSASGSSIPGSSVPAVAGLAVVSAFAPTAASMDPQTCAVQGGTAWYDNPNFDWMMKMTALVGAIMIVLGALRVLYMLFSVVDRAKVVLVVKGKIGETTSDKKQKDDISALPNTDNDDDAKNQKGVRTWPSPPAPQTPTGST